MPTEADTCRTYVLPALYHAGWTDDYIREQASFTDGRIIVAGGKADPTHLPGVGPSGPVTPQLNDTLQSSSQDVEAPPTSDHRLRSILSHALLRRYFLRQRRRRLYFVR